MRGIAARCSWISRLSPVTCTGMNGIQFSGTVVITSYLTTEPSGDDWPPGPTCGISPCRYARVCLAVSRPGLLSPLASGTVFSIPHTMSATSSRTSQTSSAGGPCCTFDTVGSSTRLVSAGPPPSTLTVNMLQCCQAWSAALPAALIQNRSPKVFCTTNPLTVAMEPDGSVYGITNQSFEKTSANSRNSSLAKSVVLASMSPKFVLRSSKAHQRVFGMPANDTGTGIIDSGGLAAGGPGLPGTGPSEAPGSTSTLYQSSLPWQYPVAAYTFSVADVSGAD